MVPDSYTQTYDEGASEDLAWDCRDGDEVVDDDYDVAMRYADCVFEEAYGFGWDDATHGRERNPAYGSEHGSKAMKWLQRFYDDGWAAARKYDERAQRVAAGLGRQR